MWRTPATLEETDSSSGHKAPHGSTRSHMLALFRPRKVTQENRFATEAKAQPLTPNINSSNFPPDQSPFPASQSVEIAATMSDAQLYEDTFTITTLLDQTYDRVARVMGTSADSTTSVTLDINSELYPLNTGENVNMLIATTLNLDGSSEDRAKTGWRPPKAGEQTLADLWDYVCYGKVYRHEETGEGVNM